MTKAPMPFSAPTISAETTSSRAIDVEMRKPARMEGSAPGRTTLRTMSAKGSPKLCAMRMRLRGTESTPLAADMAVGKKTPSAMVAIFDVSPMPSHRIIRGRSAIFGIGKSAETTEKPAARAKVKRPMPRPSARPATAPSDQPAAMRSAEMPICWRRSPCAISRQSAAAMASGLGKNSGLTCRKLDAACQSVIRPTSATAPPMRLSRGAKPAPRSGTGRRLRLS